MLNVNELENRWRKYKIKSYIPYGVILVSIGIITLLISSIYTTKASTKDIVEVKHIPKGAPKILDVETKNLKGKMVLSPSLDFMSRMEYDNKSHREFKKTPKQTIQKPKAQKPKKIKKQEIKKQIVKKSSLQIKRHTKEKNIAHVIKRFEKNNNPALSLFIAKKYYELGNYYKSYNYALITNELNQNIESSWIIFAKSLVKLNKKSAAIKTLKIYLKDSQSNQAKMLLEEIESGRFR